MTLSDDGSRGAGLGGGGILPGDPVLGQQFGELLLLGPGGHVPLECGAKRRFGSEAKGRTIPRTPHAPIPQGNRASRPLAYPSPRVSIPSSSTPTTTNHHPLTSFLARCSESRMCLSKSTRTSSSHGFSAIVDSIARVSAASCASPIQCAARFDRLGARSP